MRVREENGKAQHEADQIHLERSITATQRQRRYRRSQEIFPENRVRLAQNGCRIFQKWRRKSWSKVANTARPTRHARMGYLTFSRRGMESKFAGPFLVPTYVPFYLDLLASLPISRFAVPSSRRNGRDSIHLGRPIISQQSCWTQRCHPSDGSVAGQRLGNTGRPLKWAWCNPSCLRGCIVEFGSRFVPFFSRFKPLFLTDG